jgi:hypothetical protein
MPGCIALIWFGLANRIGESPRFLQNKLMEMVYPVTASLFVVLGIAKPFGGITVEQENSN